MDETRDINARQKRNARSKVSNGSRLFVEPTDGRTAKGRRFKDLIYDISVDLGGYDLLSANQKLLIRRNSLVATLCENMEALAVEDRPSFSVDDYVVLVNCQRRLCETLGLKRVARPINDGSTALTEFFSQPPPKTPDHE